MVKDATAGPRHPELGDGYKAAVINYGFLANAVLSTDDAVKAMSRRQQPLTSSDPEPSTLPARRHDHDPHDEIQADSFPVRGHRVDPRPDQPGLGSTTGGGAPQDREGRRPGHLLPRGRAEGRPDGAAAPRLPDQLADVPQPDPRAGGPVPRGRAGLPRLRPQLDAAARQVRLHLRQPGEGDRRVHREARADEVRHLRAGLRRPGRLPPGGQAPGADHRHRGAERQRLRRGTGQRLLEADQGVLEGAEQQGETRRPSRAAHLRGDQVAVHDTG